MSSLFRSGRKWDNSQGIRITKNDSIWGAFLQLNLGRWKRASCPKIVNNVLSTGLMRAYHSTVLGIHSCNAILGHLFLKLEKKGVSLQNLKNVMD